MRIVIGCAKKPATKRLQKVHSDRSCCGAATKDGSKASRRDAKLLMAATLRCITMG